MDNPTCDMCNSYMRFVERIPSKKYYRIRRFECVCGYKKTLFGSSYIDEEKSPENALNDINRMFKQEEENRKPIIAKRV